jgi:excinuclease ABC subunit B
MTDSMRLAIDETERRRTLQVEYNKKHGITPATIRKAVRDVIEATKSAATFSGDLKPEAIKALKPAERKQLIEKLEKEMKQAAKDLLFEKAAQLRDVVFSLRKEPDGGDWDGPGPDYY